MTTQSLTIHGVLLNLNGLGVLLRGVAGIGKSDLALGLIDRGHRLVADDVIELRKSPAGLHGHCPSLLQDHLAVSDIGFVNVREQFGAKAIMRETKIELLIDLTLEPLDKHPLGMTVDSVELMGQTLDRLIYPVRPQRAHALLIETLVKQYQTTHQHKRSALLKRHARALGQTRP